MTVRSKRQAEEEAQAEEERREYEARMTYWRERGWKPMAKEPPMLPMWQCLRCSGLAFDRELHDAWHASIGQEVTTQL
jgi:hypothetical protein